MIKLEVRYILKKDMREAFYNGILSQGIDKDARAEDGNLRYDFEIPAESDALLLHELWENQEALDRHAEMPHYKALALLKEKYVLETLIDKNEK